MAGSGLSRDDVSCEYNSVLCIAHTQQLPMLFYMSNEPPFWQWLLRKLNEAGMDRTEFAEKAGVHKSAVSRWLGNTSKPDLPNARRIAHALDVSLVEVLIAADLAEPEDFRPEETAGIPRKV